MLEGIVAFLTLLPGFVWLVAIPVGLVVIAAGIGVDLYRWLLKTKR